MLFASERELKHQSTRVFNARGGRFWWTAEEQCSEIGFFHLLVRAVCPSAAIFLARATLSSLAHFLVSSLPLCRSTSTVASQDFVSAVTLTGQQITEAGQLEPSFGHLLRDAKVDNGTILALCRCQITWDSTTRQKVSNCSQWIGHKSRSRRYASQERVRKDLAWKKAKAQLEVKTSTEALQRQHGEPITVLPEDWTSVIVQFKKKYGADLQDEELPSQHYYEDFQERLSAGTLRADPLDPVISMVEAELQDPLRKYGSHLNAQLTFQTRKRYSSVAPKNFEELRRTLKSYVLSTRSWGTCGCWLSSGS